MKIVKELEIVRSVTPKRAANQRLKQTRDQNKGKGSTNHEFNSVVFKNVSAAS